MRSGGDIAESSVLDAWLSQQMEAQCKISESTTTKIGSVAVPTEEKKEEFEESDDNLLDLPRPVSPSTPVEEFRTNETDEKESEYEYADDADDADDFEREVVCLPRVISPISSPAEAHKRRDAAVTRAVTPVPAEDNEEDTGWVLTQKEYDMDKELREMADGIYKELGPFMTEGEYQGCLKIDLEEIDGYKVEKESNIPIFYKGSKIGTRRSNLLVTLPDCQRIVIELKHVINLQPRDLMQLKFYMQCHGVDNGYLLNFPREKGSVPYPLKDESAKYTCEVISGPSSLKNLQEKSRKIKPPSKPQPIHLIKVERDMSVPRPAKNTPPPKYPPLTPDGQPCPLCPKQKSKWCSEHQEEEEEYWNFFEAPFVTVS